MAIVKGKNYEATYESLNGANKFPGNLFNAKLHILADEAPVSGVAASDEFILAKDVPTGIFLEAGVIENDSVGIILQIDGVNINVGEEMPKGEMRLIPDATVAANQKLYIKYAGQN